MTRKGKNALDHVKPRQNAKLELTPHRVTVRDALDVRREVRLAVEGLASRRKGRELLLVASGLEGVLAPAPETDWEMGGGKVLRVGRAGR